mgnify:FL=1
MTFKFYLYYSVMDVELQGIGSGHSLTSSTSSNLDQESERHNREISQVELDFQRVTISGEDHSGVCCFFIMFQLSDVKQGVFNYFPNV